MEKGRQRFPTLRQAIIIGVSGIVLGLSSCFAFLSTINIGGSGRGSQTAPVVFAVGFGAGIVLLIVGVVFLLVIAAREIFSSRRTGAIPPLVSGEISVPRENARPAIPHAALSRLGVAIIVRLAVSGLLLLLRRPLSNPPRYWTLLLLAFVLDTLPYVVALFGLRSGWQGPAVALAAGYSASSLLLGLSEILGTVTRPYAGWTHVLPIELPSLFATTAVLWFAIAAYRATPAPSRSPATLLLTFVIAWDYIVFILPRLLHGVS